MMTSLATSNASAPSGADIINVCEEIKALLLEKNRKYGDSALNPSRIFSNSSPIEQIKVRIDDKLSRIKSSQFDEDEDVIDDLIGYLVLLKIAKLRSSSGDGLKQDVAG